MSYAGGKAGPGVYHKIISLMPKHEIYIEPFYGGGAIMRLKRPAKLNIGIDRDRAAIEKARLPAESRNGAVEASSAGTGVEDSGSTPRLPATFRAKLAGLPSSALARTVDTPETRWIFNEDDGIDFLGFVATWWNRLFSLAGPVLIYCDPPYMRHTCASRCRYKYDLTDADHRRLLRVLQDLNRLPDPPMLMISGYDSELYKEMLPPPPEWDSGRPMVRNGWGWRHIQFQAMTRGGKQATEHLWFNFAPPQVLHDYRYMGTGFRDRERIKRRQTHWVNRLKKMPEAEKQALLNAIQETATVNTGRAPEET